MKVISLQSGSNGNCIYVEADGVRILFDAGISGIQTQERLALHGRDAEGLAGPTKIGCLEAFVVYLVSVPLST